MISTEEKQERLKAVNFAVSNNRLEGLEPDEKVIKIAMKWVNGEISFEEYGRRVYEIHGLRFSD